MDFRPRQWNVLATQPNDAEQLKVEPHICDVPNHLYFAQAKSKAGQNKKDHNL